MISALIKLSAIESEGLSGLVTGTLSLSMFSDRMSRFGIFSRHPPLDERVRRLLAIA